MMRRRKRNVFVCAKLFVCSFVCLATDLRPWLDEPSIDAGRLKINLRRWLVSFYHRYFVFLCGNIAVIIDSTTALGCSLTRRNVEFQFLLSNLWYDSANITPFDRRWSLVAASLLVLSSSSVRCWCVSSVILVLVCSEISRDLFLM